MPEQGRVTVLAAASRLALALGESGLGLRVGACGPTIGLSRGAEEESRAGNIFPCWDRAASAPHRRPPAKSIRGLPDRPAAVAPAVHKSALSTE